MEQKAGKAAAEKGRIRQKMKKLRGQVSEDRRACWDRKLAKRLFSMDEWKQECCVYCYISVRNEAGTEALIQELWDRNISVAVPKVQGKDMDFYYINSMEDLEPGAMGIPEPKSACRKAVSQDAPVIVPGLAFSQDFSRLGYGGGYYDRFFEKEPKHLKIGICYEFQLEPELLSEPWDTDMDVIVTPDRCLVREEKEHA